MEILAEKNLKIGFVAVRKFFSILDSTACVLSLLAPCLCSENLHLTNNFAEDICMRSCFFLAFLG